MSNLKKTKKIIKQCLYIFDYRFKKNIIFTIFFITLLSILEILGIGIFIPLFISLIEPNHPFITEIQAIHPYISKNYNLFILGSIFLIFFIKFLSSLFINFKINVYIFRLFDFLSKKFFHSYLNQDYEFFFKKNTAEITRNIYSEIGVFINQIVFSLIMIVKNIFIISSLTIFLFVYDFLFTTTILTIIFIVAYIYLKFFRKHLKEIGEKLKDKSFDVLNNLSEIFLGIKEIKIFKLEKYFYNEFKNNFLELSNYRRKSLTYSFLPKLFFEFFLVIVLIFLLFLMINSNLSEKEIIFKIGFFSFGLLRILPSLIEVSEKIQSIQIYNSSLDNIYNELQNINNSSLEMGLINNEKKILQSIELKDLSFYYKKDNPILTDINLKLEKNNIIGIIGESGAGKTTLVDIISGIISPKYGSIYVNEKIISKNLSFELRNMIGYVTQSNFFFDNTIKENIIFGKENDKLKENELLQEVIKNAQLSDFIESLENGINTKIGQAAVRLSGGQKQRISIARSLYREPRLLILDEATNALDIKNEKKIFDIINSIKKDMIVIVVSHNIDIKKYCDKVYEVKSKRLILKS